MIDASIESSLNNYYFSIGTWEQVGKGNTTALTQGTKSVQSSLVQMSFPDRKRNVYSYLVVVLIISALYASDYKVSATRILKAVEEQSQTINKVQYNKSQFFHRVYDHNRGLQHNKRRVPSCPDPLHNK
ncbi:hypothetical protein POM88_030780 [Heracleum sosnowskyi]|uniref:Uncharacterized protein n=1 Tax=Heracleum sosnowskyi TaxID=360622 RepID=A0AAD8HW56_9APIA|nr:hypothetical protein POM88_030780 [Heracleum sosnowskyi]